MRKVLIVAVLALSVAGCGIFRAVDAVSGAKVPAKEIVIAAYTFDGLEASATNYLRLKRCSPQTTVVCRDPKATDIIIPAVRSGRSARNELKAFIRAHPGELGPSGAYDALVGANNVLQQAFQQYGVR